MQNVQNLQVKSNHHNRSAPPQPALTVNYKPVNKPGLLNMRKKKSTQNHKDHGKHANTEKGTKTHRIVSPPHRTTNGSTFRECRRPSLSHHSLGDGNEIESLLENHHHHHAPPLSTPDDQVRS